MTMFIEQFMVQIFIEFVQLPEVNFFLARGAETEQREIRRSANSWKRFAREVRHLVGLKLASKRAEEKGRHFTSVPLVRTLFRAFTTVSYSRFVTYLLTSNPWQDVASASLRATCVICATVIIWSVLSNHYDDSTIIPQCNICQNRVLAILLDLPE